MKPSDHALCACWWLSRENASWSWRAICHSRAIFSVCWPIDSPVRGSPVPGKLGLKCRGLIPRKGAIRSPKLFARKLRSMSCRYSWPKTIGGSLTVSTPPAMPASICPSAILFATAIAASMLVPQARCTSRPGVSGERPESRSDSRARFHWLECFITAPATTSPRRWPRSEYRSTTAFRDAVSISWLPTLA